MAAAAAVAALGLREEEEEENKEEITAGGDPEDPAGWGEDSDEDDDDDDPPLDEEAIEELKADFRSSLIRVFGYTEVLAMVTQDKLGWNEPVDLLHTWDSDNMLESACNNFI
jgi:hypothetical protein